MRKEILISILVGLSLGLIITYGFYTARLSTRVGNITQKDDLEFEPTPVPANTTADRLIITTPEDELVTTESKLTVRGKAGANNFIAITLLDQIQVLTADDQGAFSLEVTLKSGGNVLVIQSTNETGEVETETRTVVLADESTLSASASAAVKSTPTPKVTIKPTVRPTTTR
jgi:hypothetical protein